MTAPGRPINLRLPADLASRFDEVHLKEFAALPATMVMRMMLSHVLEKPVEEQVEILRGQMKKPVSQPATAVRKQKGQGPAAKGR